MQFYLGPAGNLQALPIVEHSEQVTVTPEQPGGITTSLAGGRTNYACGRVRSRWTISWRLLTPAQFAVLRALKAGRYGRPLRLIDPERPNLAHPNIATGGSEERSAAGWLASSGSLAWVPVADPPAGVLVHGVIAWTRSTTAAGDLAPGRTGHAYRAPVLNAQNMRASMWVRATSGTVAASFGVDHFDAAGAVTTVVGSAATVPTSWTELVSAWTPTAGRVAAAPVLRIAAGQPVSVLQVASAPIVYGGTGLPWQEGGGAPVVIIPPDGLTESRPWAGEVDVTLALVEA